LVRGRQLCIQFSTIEGSLAELFRFWCWQLQKLRLCFWRYQVQKLRKSRRIASFFMLSPSKMEEALQNSFVFDGVSITLSHATGICKHKFGESMSWNCWCLEIRGTLTHVIRSCVTIIFLTITSLSSSCLGQ
jgi:hypothetical protein